MSALQLTANIKYKFSVKRTTAISKELFYSGFFSYPRTDSIRLAPEFINLTKDYIKNTYGEEYVGVAKVQKSSGNVQDAHEALRITGFDKTTFEKTYKDSKDYKYYKQLYELVFNRTVQSIMKPRIDNELTYIFEANGVRLGCFGCENIFLGFSILDDEKKKDEVYSFSGEYELLNKDTEELSTKAPLRFTEGTLVKKMEETGIGRPSTYEPTISKCHNNSYITVEKNYVKLTELGKSVIDYCSKHFPTTVSNIKYTASIEEQLDEVENEKINKEQEKEIPIPSFGSKMDDAVSAMEGKYMYLKDIHFLDYVLSLSKFSMDNATLEENYADRPVTYTCHDSFYNEDMSEDAFQIFVDNKICKHKAIYDKVQKNEAEASVFKDILLKLYKRFTDKLKKKDENFTFKKWHGLLFGWLYCKGNNITKIKFLFDLFANDAKVGKKYKLP